ncbi:hypothetical protein CYJ10_14835 [Cupriavidus pauculus]|uniref:Uncharacterized protein n=1 Tax=Cupriavidus pauculus TaxID=82633 RepID=A0A2N5CBS8_9BURK|nr:hypothetical protein CYJ10_14835 [Cupriavidus pauculus]
MVALPAGVTTVDDCGGLGSLLLIDMQPARQTGNSRRTAIRAIRLSVMAGSPTCGVHATNPV